MKARFLSAQSFGLGKLPPTSPALKGRFIVLCMRRPYRARNPQNQRDWVGPPLTQPFGLGYRNLPFRTGDHRFLILVLEFGINSTNALKYRGLRRN